MENLQVRDLFLENKSIVLALSGGIDSVVLLYYLHKFHSQKLRAIYINHNLSESANKWGVFCEKLCKKLNINLTIINIFPEKERNIEANARKMRYQAISQQLQKDEILCTAHHQNDQIETILLQLFRGSGVRGTSAMPKIKIFHQGWHYRPMICISKKDILQYAKYNNLSWIEDDSNTNTDFSRNFLRLKIIPQLKKHYKNLAKTLNRARENHLESKLLNDDLAQIDINKYELKSDDKLNIQNLLKLKERRIKNIIFYHLQQLKFQLPSQQIMQEIIKILSAKQDKNPLVKWDDFQIRTYQNQLYFLNTHKQQERFCPFYEKYKNKTGFEIRYRQYGEKVKMKGKHHSQSLKKLLQEKHIPPWERGNIRMYFVKNKLRAIEKIGEINIVE